MQQIDDNHFHLYMPIGKSSNVMKKDLVAHLLSQDESKEHNQQKHRNLFTSWSSDENTETCKICKKQLIVDSGNNDTGYWNYELKGYLCCLYLKNGCQFAQQQIREFCENIERTFVLRESYTKPMKRRINMKWF